MLKNMYKQVKTSFNLLESKTNQKGDAPVYFRIKLNPDLNMSTGIYLKPDEWDRKKQRVKSKHEHVSRLNRQLKEMEEKVMQLIDQLRSKGDIISREKIKFIWKNQSEITNFLISLVDYYINHLQSTNCCSGTINHYKSFKKKLIHFLQYRYSLSDMRLENLNYDFITQFEGFLSTIYHNQTNTITKNIRRLKAIINLGLKLGWLKANPFVGHKCKSEPVHPKHLIIEEVIQLEVLDLSQHKRLEVTKDLFLFMCYTGLSYSDLPKLEERNIVTINSEEFIVGSREKTNEEFTVMLLPKAKAIVEKYRTSAFNKERGKLLPIRSNECMNRNLKKIARMAGLCKNLTCHVGRHTFATLSGEHGVALESISKSLGHSSIRTTQAFYARVTPLKLIKDYQSMKQVF